MKKTYKILIILTILIILLSSLNTVQATGIWEKAREFLETGTSHTGMTQALTQAFGLDDAVKSNFEAVIDFLWGLGLLTVFICTIVLGIKYMLVNPAEKSRIKQSTTPYVVGVVIIFGALTIWRLVIIILDGSL